MSPVWLSIVYCVLLGFASLGGGLIPQFVKLTHRRMQISISFVAGVMLGVGLLHLLPHSQMELQNIDQVVLGAMAGFLVVFFLERFFHFHHHDAPDDNTLAAVCDDPTHDHSHEELLPIIVPAHTHAHDRDQGHDHDAPLLSGRFSWIGAAFGMTLHSLIDGVALAAAVNAENHGSAGIILAGLGTFLAVFLHKPFDSLTISTLMASAGWSSTAKHTVNVLYALVAPLGMAMFFIGANNFDHFHGVVGWSLAFAAGAFLCIATSDLLPELQFHSHDRGKLSLALLVGIALAWCIVFFESAGHEHHAHRPDAVERVP